MTIIKQKGVSNERHARNLRNYINSDKALLRDSQNILNAKRWYREMDETRKIAGHDKAARKGARNVTMYHQILAFLPEEADMNGGDMTPNKCMKYAKKYAQARYPDYQVVFALHRERCNADGTERYAVHMAINRTNLETGKRLAEGKGQAAKIDRARTVRKMDGEWGLQQVERDKPNSKIHQRQPRGAEKEIMERGQKSYKQNLRKWCERLSGEASSLSEFIALLETVGYKVTASNSKIFVVDTDHETGAKGNPIRFNLARLDGRYSKSSLERVFAQKTARQQKPAHADAPAQPQDGIKAQYQSSLHEAYLRYQGLVHASKGKAGEEIPRFRPPKLPEQLQADAEVRQLLLSCRNKADTLRARNIGGGKRAAQKPEGRSTQPQPQRQPEERVQDQRGKEK